MSRNRLNWRIAFSLEDVYYVVASSNVPRNDLVESWARQGGGKFTEKNGLASILTRSEKARSDCVPHVFDPDGDSLSAMKKMIAQLEKIYGRPCIKPIVKL